VDQGTHPCWKKIWAKKQVVLSDSSKPRSCQKYLSTSHTLSHCRHISRSKYILSGKAPLHRTMAVKIMNSIFWGNSGRREGCAERIYVKRQHVVLIENYQMSKMLIFLDCRGLSLSLRLSQESFLFVCLSRRQFASKISEWIFFGTVVLRFQTAQSPRSLSRKSCCNLFVSRRGRSPTPTCISLSPKR
jgi:hypothetical protein